MCHGAGDPPAGRADRVPDPYAASGVDTAAGDRAVELMKRSIAATHTPAVLGGVGGFAGLFDASCARRHARARCSPPRPTGSARRSRSRRRSTSTTPSARTSSAWSSTTSSWSARRPLFMTDYIACGRVVPERIAEIVGGIADACAAPRTALVGGETAEHPGLLAPGRVRPRRRGRGRGRGGCAARSRPRPRRRHRARARLVGAALERLLPRAPHRRGRGARLHRPARTTSAASLGETLLDAHPALHGRAARAAPLSGRRSRARAQPRDRGRHRGEPRPGAARRHRRSSSSAARGAPRRCSACWRISAAWRFPTSRAPGTSASACSPWWRRSRRPP